jgi:hypothetical protein
MKINSIQNPADSIYHDTLSLVGISDTSQYPIVQFIRNANNWYRRASSWVRAASGTWEYDDSNWTTLPEATTTLVDDQTDYSLDVTTQEIERVEVKDISGIYKQLKPVDQSQLKGTAIPEFWKTKGVPEYYDVRGFSLYLYPAPDESLVATTEGITLYFSRDIKEFGITSTSTEPGFNGDYHRIISFGCAYDYCLSNGIDDRKKGIRDEIEIYKQELMGQSNRRDRDFGNKILPYDNDCI